jgi:hypothetical protein
VERLVLSLAMMVKGHCVPGIGVRTDDDRHSTVIEHRHESCGGEQAQRQQHRKKGPARSAD